jgi:hypothetical protein
VEVEPASLESVADRVPAVTEVGWSAPTGCACASFGGSGVDLLAVVGRFLEGAA